MGDSAFSVPFLYEKGAAPQRDSPSAYRNSIERILSKSKTPSRMLLKELCDLLGGWGTA